MSLPHWIGSGGSIGSGAFLSFGGGSFLLGICKFPGVGQRGRWLFVWATV